MKRTYGTIRRLPTNDGWVIGEVEPHVALRLKQIFPVIKKTDRAPFNLYGGPQLDADLDWFMIRYPLQISDADRELMRERRLLFEKQQEEIAAILTPEWKPKDNFGFREGKAPFGYQAQAAELARRLGRLLIMDDVGLGKTVTAFAAICDPQYLPALIVPQTHIVSQWAEKLAEFTNLTYHVINKTKPYQLPPADVYICPYSKLAGWSDYADRLGIRSIVFDEMQELRHGRSTAKGIAAWNFSQFAQLKVGLTATPIYGYGAEIWHVLNYLEDGGLGSWEDFTQEWCTSLGNGKWAISNPEALGTYLRERNLNIRRADVEVGRAQPPPNIITHTIPFDAEVLETNELMMQHLAKQVLEGDFTERGQAAREFDMRMRQITGIAKAPHVAAYVRILLEAGRPVLLGGWHREVYEIWLDRLRDFNPVMYTGSETPRKKDEAKRAFVEGHSDVMILSLRSGAGLDGLQLRSNTIVFGELDWSPEVHKQFIGRLRRPGQTQQVDAIYLTADGGSDPVVTSVLGLKASQAQGIIDPFKRAGKQFSDATRIRDLARLYLEGRLGKVRSVAPAAPPTQPAQASLF